MKNLKIISWDRGGGNTPLFTSPCRRKGWLKWEGMICLFLTGEGKALGKKLRRAIAKGFKDEKAYLPTIYNEHSATP